MDCALLIVRLTFNVVAPASYAQARIWLDERVRFHSDKPQMAIYNMPFVYHVSPDHTLSVKQLRQAIQLVINKHQSLRTCLVFNTEKNILMQQLTDLNDNCSSKFFTFIESVFEKTEELHSIMQDERGNPQHFDLTHGPVFRCHVLYYKQMSADDLLRERDGFIFNFHHALFDLLSIDIFLTDLNKAYTTNELPINDDTTLRYIDCNYSCLLLLFHYISFLSMII
jgi:hypothetical protein